MFPNIATLVAFAAVMIFFGVGGAATARSNPGRIPAQIWVAAAIGVALSIYALVVCQWPWIAGSLGVFCVTHMIVCFINRNQAVPSSKGAV